MFKATAKLGKCYEKSILFLKKKMFKKNSNLKEKELPFSIDSQCKYIWYNKLHLSLKRWYDYILRLKLTQKLNDNWIEPEEYIVIMS